MAASEEYEERYKFIIVGGGIAGVTCAETLSNLCPEDKILLLTASPMIKAVTNFRKVTQRLGDFDVEERSIDILQEACPNVIARQSAVKKLNTHTKLIYTESGRYSYKYLCICTGGSPKVIFPDHPYVLGIRDTETVKVFQNRLSNARRVMIVGNGGIATELAFEIEGCDIIWAVKDKHITHTFIDGGAAEFFKPELCKNKEKTAFPTKRLKYTVREGPVITKASQMGTALGPDWAKGLKMQGSAELHHEIHVEYEVEVKRLWTPSELQSAKKMHDHLKYEQQEATKSATDWPVYAELTNGKIYGCDFIVSATGVIPNTEPFLDGNKFAVGEDGGICVNDKMETTVEGVYAAGDVCTATWEHSQYWLQMRLWSQARQMGAYAAKSMAAKDKKEEISLDFCFELFEHATKFFNYKVVLLGRFNAQGLEENVELLVRVTKDQEYVKVVMHEGKMQGAILIGETDLEETFENLILNQMDLSAFSENLLDPNIDIDDFFD